jgi:hypothetical protein
MFPLLIATHCTLIEDQRRREADVHRRGRRPAESRRPARPVREI